MTLIYLVPITLAWTQHAFTSGGGRTGGFTTYDSINNVVWYRSTGNWGPWRSYNFSTHTWTNHGSQPHAMDYNRSAAFDPIRKRIIVIGQDVENGDYWYSPVYIDASNPVGGNVTEIQILSTGDKTCENARSPGFDYDPVMDSMICWPNTGSTLYRLNLTTFVWTTISATSGMPSNADANGTFGRFRYVPLKNVFVLVNNVDRNVFVYKLTNTGSPPPPPTDTVAPSIPVGLVASAFSSSQINLSWNPSTDNVGVTGYRVYRNGVQVATVTIASYQDTGRQPSTSYSYTVAAFDAAGNVSAQSSQVSTTTLTASVPPPSDFATRCAMPGVIRCNGFDSASDIGGVWGNNTGIIPSGDPNGTIPVLDTNVKASGASSLRLRTLSNTGSDPSGSYFANFSTDLATQFGAGTDFWVQYRQFISPELLNTVFTSSNGFKNAIIGTGDKPGCTPGNLGNCYSSCSTLEITTQNIEQKKFPRLYNNCGAFAGFEKSFFNDAIGFNDISLQDRPSPYCTYLRTSGGGAIPANTQFPPTGNCVGYTAGEWMTFTYHITVGPRGANGTPGQAPNERFVNSNVKMWVARQGQASQQIFNYTADLYAGTVAKDEKYGKVWLLNYQTNKSNAQSHATVDTWYDDLIISRNPIADPSGTTPTPTPTPPPTPTVGDFNLDGLVNSIDLSLMTSAWNQNNATYDLNKDGLVNSLDYAIMVQNWSG